MVKLALSEGQKLTQNFFLKGYISTFEAEKSLKNWAFKVKSSD